MERLPAQQIELTLARKSLPDGNVGNVYLIATPGVSNSVPEMIPLILGKHFARGTTVSAKRFLVPVIRDHHEVGKNVYYVFVVKETLVPLRSMTTYIVGAGMDSSREGRLGKSVMDDLIVKTMKIDMPDGEPSELIEMLLGVTQ